MDDSSEAVESNEDIRLWLGDIPFPLPFPPPLTLDAKDCSAFSKARRMSLTLTHRRPPLLVLPLVLLPLPPLPPPQPLMPLPLPPPPAALPPLPPPPLPLPLPKLFEPSPPPPMIIMPLPLTDLLKTSKSSPELEPVRGDLGVSGIPTSSRSAWLLPLEVEPLLG